MRWDRDKERKAGKAMGIGGSIYGIVFMVIWCGIAAAMGAWFMLIFGVPMLGFMIFRLVVLLQRSKADAQPKDPWEQPQQPQHTAPMGHKTDFCPYCGMEIKENFDFCPKCGRRL